ncbi:MAG: adenylate/guanylate cyclase domain-containing protein [Chloroflexota bacterium]|nr:adenylate/guanylate cyclase domain-containing protein [Chloroflexota bacterium]
MTPVRSDLPAGTITFLFTDIEGSTKLLHELGAEGYGPALDEHRRHVRDAFNAHGGVEVDTEGDAFFVAFPDAVEAVAAAEAAQKALKGGPIKVRMGLHTGRPHRTEHGYVGVDVHEGARIAAAAHGGQVVLSKETRTFLGQRFDLLDLGEHRVKDFAAPIWIYQLGGERFPPLKTISNTNLPRPTSSFVGREREVGAIGGLLRDGARLLTLTGPGGTGKTRLAIEAAIELVPAFRNGVFWIDLAPLRDPALVAETIGKTLGAKDGLADHIGEREMLLLLDNLEQVVSAAPALASLAETCPNLRLLVTSRERLRVRGEIEYAVPALANEEAVSLFCERAQLARDDTIVELCRRLDDLPLAVELAAARASVLSPAQILERLAKRLDLLKGGRDAEARQHTLRATIEWSYDLLNDDEKSLVARLAVFRGGCTVQAAEEIVDADLDTLAALVDKSLVGRGDGRFTMLEMIREFAAERLEGSGTADELWRRHSKFFLALVEEAETHVAGYERPWLDRLDSELDNIRAAFDHFESQGDGEQMQRLAGALGRFWFMRGHIREGRQRTQTALAADSRSTRARASALLAWSLLAETLSEMNAIVEATSIYRALGDRRGEALALGALGDYHAGLGAWQEASERLEASLQALHDLGDHQEALFAARELGWIYISLGERERGIALHHDTLRRARQLGNERIESIVLGALAMSMLEDRRLDEATELLVESQRLQATLGDPMAAALNVIRFAALLLGRERTETAAKLAACADALIEELGLSLHDWDPVFIDEINAGIRAGLNESTLTRATDEGARMTAEAAVSLALAELALPQTRSASGT